MMQSRWVYFSIGVKASTCNDKIYLRVSTRLAYWAIFQGVLYFVACVFIETVDA